MRIAVFPGSFDPFTKGHEDVVEKSLGAFDKVIIGIGVNESKNYAYPIENRIAHIRSIYKDVKGIEVEAYSGLTTDFCAKVNASHIVRGLRNATDFDYENKIALMNKSMMDVETICFFTSPEVMAINSSIIRELVKNGANIEKYVTNVDRLTYTL
jgi:pantetheine-phosphate adenylyltransferase